MSIRTALIIALLVRYAGKKLRPHNTYIDDCTFLSSGSGPGLYVRGPK